MPEPIDIEQMAARNRGVDVERLRKALESAAKMPVPPLGKYRYNLLPPFAGHTLRHRPARVGGPSEDIRDGNVGYGR